MKYRELIIYRSPEYGALLMQAAGLIEKYEKGEYKADKGQEAGREALCGLIHDLLDLAASNGFYGNLWHCMLTNLLVNHENAYSRACEIRGQVEGSINKAALHDFEIFRAYFDYDFSVNGKLLWKEYAGYSVDDLHDAGHKRIPLWQP